MSYELLGQKTQRPQFTFDTLMQLKDAGLVAASAACQVAAAAKIIDLGGATMFKGVAVIDVSAIEIASNDEKYIISLQLSSSATFASAYVSCAMIELGANEVLEGDQDSGVYRYLIPFTNYFNGVCWQYLRGYTTVSGTIASGGGINYTMFIGKDWANL